MGRSGAKRYIDSFVCAAILFVDMPWKFAWIKLFNQVDHGLDHTRILALECIARSFRRASYQLRHVQCNQWGKPRRRNWGRGPLQTRWQGTTHDSGHEGGMLLLATPTGGSSVPAGRRRASPAASIAARLGLGCRRAARRQSSAGACESPLVFSSQATSCSPSAFC